jgi:hypothetical protein
MVAPIKTTRRVSKVPGRRSRNGEIIGRAADYLQPRQIKGEAHANRPRKDLIVVDPPGELHRIKKLKRIYVCIFVRPAKIKSAPTMKSIIR